MANPLSRGHSLLADYLDASGVVPLPISEVHMNAPVPTREHVGEEMGGGGEELGLGGVKEEEAEKKGSKMHGGIERKKK